MARFRNWAGNVSVGVSGAVVARTEGDVVEAVRSAAARRTRLKVVGSGHSWSAIAAPDGAMLDVGALGDVGRVESGLVTVGGGARLSALVDSLAEQGFSPTILGSVTAQRVAGALATATHGSSLVHSNLGSFVRGMRIVTGSGDVVVLKEGDRRLLATRAGLGALGVVTSVTLAVEPTFRLREDLTVQPVDDVAASLDEIARSAEYVKVWWLPHTPLAAVFRYTRTDAPIDAPGPWRRTLDERVINGWVFPGLLLAGTAFPRLVDVLNRVVAGSYFKPKVCVDRMDRQLTVAMPALHRETEWLVPMASASEGFRRVIALIRDEGFHVGFVTEVRFVRGDDAWMSTAEGGDRCAIGAYIPECRDRERYFRRVREEMLELDGRPHWGKENDGVTPTDVDRLWSRSGEFRALAREWDPTGVFRNPFLERVVGL